jgi:hypothetical protein
VQPQRFPQPRLRHLSLCSAAVALALSGCTLLELKDDAAAFYASTVLAGRVQAPAGRAGRPGPVVVAAVSRKPGLPQVVHRVLLHEPGGFELIVPHGEYRLVAFGDDNGNGRYDAGEPAGEYGDPPVQVGGGASSSGGSGGAGVIALLDFALSAAPPPSVRAAAVALGSDGPRLSTQAGAIAALDDPAFGAEQGRRGYWAPLQSFRAVGGNVHFLEPYDPDRIPILFVHGAAGSPQDWRHFFEHIDRSRFQPWFFHYPSGASLDSMAHLLFWKLLNLQLRHRFETLVLTAHSMGGLVVRTMLLNHGEQLPQARLFVSLSTPWAGEAAAELGVRHSPAVVPSWRDMRPEGRFMQQLFARPLPASIEHYLLFGHKGGYSLLRPNTNTDGTVTLASQLRIPAQQEARRIYGFDEDHESILRSPHVMALFRSIVAGHGQREAAVPQGRVQLDLGFAGGEPGARGLPSLLLVPAQRDDGARRSLTISLTAQDAGRSIGPIPAGIYDASLLLGSYRTQPRRQRVHIEAGRSPSLRFELSAQGSLAGYVAADGSDIDHPAGSWRPPHPTVHIRAITLAGPAGTRTLVPRRGNGDALQAVERYLDDLDDAVGPQFSFVGLPAGRYELTIDAQGYLPHRTWHDVVPGRQGPLQPVVLTPLR